MDILKNKIQERIKQHRDNLALWKSGALRPTVQDDDEQCEAMHDLCVAIAELETVLKEDGGIGQITEVPWSAVVESAQE